MNIKMNFKWVILTILKYWLTGVVIGFLLILGSLFLNKTTFAFFLFLSGMIYIIINFFYLIGIPSTIHLIISSEKNKNNWINNELYTNSIYDNDLRLKISLISLIVCLIISLFLCFLYTPSNIDTNTYENTPYIQKA